MPTGSDYDGEHIRSLIAGWKKLRAHFERTGAITDADGLPRDEWLEVLDVERAVSALGNYRLRNDPAHAQNKEEETFRNRMDRAASAAFAAVACRLFGGWGERDIRYTISRPRGLTPRDLDDATIEFCAVYLAGGSLDEADRAFEASVLEGMAA